MRLLVLASVLSLGACHGTLFSAGGDDDLVGDDSGVDADPHAEARATFDSDVAPLLDATCAPCHSSADATGFLAPNPDVYATVMAWPGLVDVDSPSSSRMLTKGSHEGPAWTADQKAIVRAWIDLEAAAVGPGEVVETAVITPVEGHNTIPLDDLGLVGSTVAFDAEKLTLGLYLSNLTVTGGTGGAHLVHPLFVTWVDDVPDVDAVDSFDTVDLDVAQGTTTPIGGGLIMLVNVPPTAQLSVHFELAEPYTGGDTTPTGGCKDVPAFTANARGPLSASCVSCHGGNNAGATGATDMTSINDTSTGGQTTACPQILSRINLASPNTSGLFVSVDPNAGANHPFKFGTAAAFTTFRNAVSVWITAENAAP